MNGSEVAGLEKKLDNHKLHKQLKLAFRKIQHTTELLRESEASSLRLGDQAKLLKEEIRRWGREGGREASSLRQGGPG